MSTWLIGAGYMAQEYAKVLDELMPEFEVIGRSEKSALNFESIINRKVKQGGLKKALEESSAPDQAIVAVGVEELAKTTTELVKAGVKKILLEKPGGLNKSEISDLSDLANVNEAEILIAYNRRFYESTATLLELIKNDGGATSCIFEFTEWSHIISSLAKAPGVKDSWFLANSTHVADLAFYICGFPREFSSWHQGSLSWHNASARFCGSGITDRDVLFSYHADWSAPGRWGVEVLTKKNRYILKPLEELKVVELGSVEIQSIEIDDQKDRQFKPGVYKQIEAFIESDYNALCSLEDQLKHVDIYNKMAGYD
jgi:predicted dehydrogenase